MNLISEKNENLRPTKDRVKEALFNILQFKIKDKSFLDLFGGTGQIGIEAFSRGARSVTIVDNSREAIRLIGDNILKLKAPHDNVNVLKADAVNFLSYTNSIFDIVFLDPPYLKIELLENCMNLLPKIVSKDAIVIVETLVSNDVKNSYGQFNLQRKYKYGKISLNSYKIVEYT